MYCDELAYCSQLVSNTYDERVALAPRLGFQDNEQVNFRYGQRLTWADLTPFISCSIFGFAVP